MTSGTFETYRISDISVGDRQRSQVFDIEDLADSLRRNGLINPIVVTRDGALVAGERRLTAAKLLGWTHISVQFAEDLDQLSLHLIELEENIKRVDLDWRDQCHAVARYHALRSEAESEWTQEDTAQAIGLRRRTVDEQLSVARELERGNERVSEAPKFSVARGIVRRKAERAKAAALETLEPAAPAEVPILHADFHEWAPSYDGPRFNFIHCDFPYGINADKHDQGNAAARGGYADTREVYFALLETFVGNADRLCADHTYLMFWFSMEYYGETISILERAGFTARSRPLIWHRSDNSGIIPDPRRLPRGIYETALMCRRGDPHIVGPVSDLVAHPNTKSVHMSEKPRDVLRHFFRMFIDEFTYVLDPTCGSGNALRVASDMGAKHVVGLEADEEFYKAAKEAYHDD